MSKTIVYQAHPPIFRNNPLGFILRPLLIPAVADILILIVHILSKKQVAWRLPDSERP